MNMAKNRINRVYTRTGDDGQTGLGRGHRVAKDSARIEAYGTVDELNSFLGLALALGVDEALRPDLARVQNELFHLGSDLCVREEDKKKFKIPQVEARDVERLEGVIERLQKDLQPLEEFILPSGTEGAAALHVARTVSRRAERLVVTCARDEPIGPHVVRYLNRLSDLLFVMARHENRVRGREEKQWEKSEP